MTISRETSSFLNEILNADVIPQGRLAYFRSRLKNRFHAMVLERFARLESEGKITQAKLATRISREPAQISRWFGSAGNWEYDTLSDVLLGMGCEPSDRLIELAQFAQSSEAENTLPNQRSGLE